MRSPPFSAVNSTPVRIGLASSVLAARTTWRNASPNCGCRQGHRRGRRRGQLRIVVERQRAHTELRAAAGDVDFVSFDGNFDFAGSHRTHDVGCQRAGRTTPPSPSPPTASVSWIVRSRSVPVMLNWSPTSSRRRPDNTGSAPVRPVAARPAVESASASASRSQRNFTGRPFSQ